MAALGRSEEACQYQFFAWGDVHGPPQAVAGVQQRAGQEETHLWVLAAPYHGVVPEVHRLPTSKVRVNWLNWRVLSAEIGARAEDPVSSTLLLAQDRAWDVIRNSAIACYCTSWREM